MTTTTTTQSATPRTVAAGLRLGKQLKGRLSEIDKRLPKAATWTDKDPASFDFAELIEERSGIVERLLVLKGRIALANAGATVTLPGAKGRTVSLHEAVLRYEELKGWVKLYRELPTQASKERKVTQRQRGYDDITGAVTSTETEQVTHVALTERQRAEKVEALQQELSELDAVIQDANHVTVLPT